MTKEELIKLSRENLRKSKQGSLCECYDEAFIKGYELSKKRIAELEYQLTHRNCVDCSNHSSNLRMRNLALEKENAELKETCNKWFEHLKNREEELLNELNNQNAKYNKQIEELEAQIEKMKDCSNCKYKYIQDNADLGEGTRTDPCLSCRSHNMWEFEDWEGDKK